MVSSDSTSLANNGTRNGTGTTITYIFKLLKSHYKGSTHAIVIYRKSCSYLFRCSRMENGMREKQIEQKLVKATKNMGGIALKFVSPGFDGMPDRIVLLPGGHIGFVEVKAMGCKPRPLQLSRHGLLRRLGFKVYVLDDERQIEKIITEIRGDAK